MAPAHGDCATDTSVGGGGLLSQQKPARRSWSEQPAFLGPERSREGLQPWVDTPHMREGQWTSQGAP